MWEPCGQAAKWWAPSLTYRARQKSQLFYFSIFSKNSFARSFSRTHLTTPESFTQIGPAISEIINHKAQDSPPLHTSNTKSSLRSLLITYVVWAIDIKSKDTSGLWDQNSLKSFNVLCGNQTWKLQPQCLTRDITPCPDHLFIRFWWMSSWRLPRGGWQNYSCHSPTARESPEVATFRRTFHRN